MARIARERWAAKLIRASNEIQFAVNDLERSPASFLPAKPVSHTINEGVLFFPHRFDEEAFEAFKSQGKETPGMPDATTDRRGAPRYPLILPAEVTDLLSSMKFTARTSDLSRTGCYIDMLQPLPQGIQIHVRLQNQGEAFESPARVIYVSPGLGMGVAFAESPPADQQAILDHWLADAAKTSR